MDDDGNSFVEGILHDSKHITIIESTDSNYKEYKDISNLTVSTIQETDKNEGADKHSAVWTTNATLTLLKLYESNLEMVETPKKKTRLWAAISDNLRSYNIEMTPDQVRWKINALTKKYKLAVDSGHRRFKYFKEMSNIFGQSDNVDEFPMSELFQRKRNIRKNNNTSIIDNYGLTRGNYESKATIELRKIRLANRIEADRSQSKVNLEKQWLDYLKRQEDQKQWRDSIFERSLQLREKELEIRRKELEMKEALELKKLELKEKEQEEMLQIERDKCDMLRRIVAQKEVNNVK